MDFFSDCMYFLSKQEVGKGHTEGPIYNRAVDQDSLLTGLWTKRRCVKLQYENDVQVKSRVAEKRLGTPHRRSSGFTLAATSALISSCVSARRFLASSVLRSQSAMKDCRCSAAWGDTPQSAIYEQLTHTHTVKCIWMEGFLLTSSSKKYSCCLDAIS